MLVMVRMVKSCCAGVALLFGLQGCLPPSSATDSTTPISDDGAGCHIERPTGSNIGREVCRTPDQVRDDRENARNLHRPPRVTPTKTEGGT